MTQEFTSKFTSINSTRLPAIYKKIDWRRIRKEVWNEKHKLTTVLDYGCGRYTSHIRDFMMMWGVSWVGWDPYWLNAIPLDEVVKMWNPDVIICSNVLNVIKEKEDVSRIHEWLKSHYSAIHPFPDTTMYFITVYEGNKSLVGEQSKKDCYQRNETLDCYIKYSIENIKKGVLAPEPCLQYLV